MAKKMSGNEVGGTAAAQTRRPPRRPRALGNPPGVRCGSFTQFSLNRVALGGYWFDPGSGNQVSPVSIGARFRIREIPR